MKVNSEPHARPNISVTFFSDFAARTKREADMTLPQLADVIRETNKKAKQALPWLKLARFGNTPTPIGVKGGKKTGGSLRHNDNVLAITGIEADYDGEQIPVSDAIARLKDVGVLSIVYTSPSHTPDKPRWRVLCPLAREHLPEQRDMLMGRLAGLFRGAFSDESWTLSQSFYYGSVSENPDHQVELIDGQSIDVRDNLPSIGKRPDAQPKERQISSGGTYVSISNARLEGYCISILANVRKAADGQKHEALRNAALALGGIAEAAGFSDDAAVNWLMDALPTSVLDWDAARTTASWGLVKGREKPIKLPDRPNLRAPTNGTRPAAEAQSAPVLGNGKDHDIPMSAGDADPPPKKPKKKGLNALALVNFMAASREWRRALRINLFTETLQVCPQFPPSSAPAGTFRTLREPSDLLEAMLHFQGAGFPKASKGLVWDSLCVMAHRNAFHPVQDYLDGLRWDGEQRLGRLFQHYFNAELPDEADLPAKPGEATPRDKVVCYLEHISQCFMVSAVARIRKPGCKVDHLPVLVGPQGYHKSQAIRALCADAAWFSDDLSTDLMERDTKESLTGKWLVELAEMPHAKKEVERVKAFFSRQTDRYRRAYDRTTNDWPRQCVFMGSSNDLELIDNTGNRRTWPVEIAGPIDIARITTDRDQLWAEAVACYETGYAWWLGGNIEKIAGEQQNRFQDEDIWTGELSKWAEGRNRFTLADAMVGALGFPDPKQIDKASQNRASGCLKRLGFRRRQSRYGITTRYLWTRVEAAPDY
jgi:hypothetical protein